MRQKGIIRKRYMGAGSFYDAMYRIGQNGVERVKYLTLNGVKRLVPMFDGPRTAVVRATDVITQKMNGMGINPAPKKSNRSVVLNEIARRMNGGMIMKL